MEKKRKNWMTGKCMCMGHMAHADLHPRISYTKCIKLPCCQGLVRGWLTSTTFAKPGRNPKESRKRYGVHHSVPVGSAAPAGDIVLSPTPAFTHTEPHVGHPREGWHLLTLQSQNFSASLQTSWDREVKTTGSPIMINECIYFILLKEDRLIHLITE